MTQHINAGSEFAIYQAIDVIDTGMSEMLHRELVSAAEVADLLLDLRNTLAPPIGSSALSGA